MEYNFHIQVAQPSIYPGFKCFCWINEWNNKHRTGSFPQSRGILLCDKNAIDKQAEHGWMCSLEKDTQAHTVHPPHPPMHPPGPGLYHAAFFGNSIF
jgi:hypothetical protein